MNTPGHCLEFEFMEDYGTPRKAKLTITYYTMNNILGSACHDSQWMTQLPDGRWNGPWDELKILGTDGNLWNISPHSSTYYAPNNTIKVWTESEPFNGGNRNLNFEIVDWQNNHWKVVVDSPVNDNTQPGFMLTRI